MLKEDIQEEIDKFDDEFYESHSAVEINDHIGQSLKTIATKAIEACEVKIIPEDPSLIDEYIMGYNRSVKDRKVKKSNYLNK